MTQLPVRRAASAAPSRLLPLLALLLGLSLAGCTGLGGPGAAPASTDRAERLLAQGNPVAAAEMFERLAAGNPPPDGIAFGFRAVRAWIAAGRIDDAQRVFGGIPVPAAPRQQFDRNLLQVELLLARNENVEAWRRAAALAEPRDAIEATQLYALRQQAALAANQPVEAVRAGIAAERFATTDAERSQLRRDLLGRLRQAVERGVRLEPQAAREPLVRGWLELGGIAAGAVRSPLGAAGEIDRWRGRYPGHPGSTVVVSEILGSGPAGAFTPGDSRVALLLPLTGRQGAAAALVRDGFQAALRQLPESRRPQVTVVDTGTTSVGSALLQAQSDGTGFIVGPLTREEIAEAARDHAGRTPMLLLNFLPLDQPAPSNVYQFALSPEDEARQIARRALAASQQRAIVIAPTGDWGNRVVAAFRDEVTRGGGTVLDQASYDPTRNDFTDAITRVLRVNDSRARHQQVEQIVGGKLSFEPRRRMDVQMIFAAGQPMALRQIRPQL